MKTIMIYLIVVNIAAFAIMGADKYRARRNRWRIKEVSIFALGLIGGGAGLYLGMKLFRHKTRHLEFTMGIPAIIILNIITLWYVLQRLE
ncbi:MAG: DUF1294 domain-containing protein [Clostridiaceae bacterium]|nr:DUF1294 domain-containing protein [Clostridiaceae bacterium]